VEVQLHSLITSALDKDEWSVSHHGRFNPVKRPWYPLKRRLDKPQSWSGHFTEEIHILLLPGFKPRIIQPITFVTILVILSLQNRVYVFIFCYVMTGAKAAFAICVHKLRQWEESNTSI
jgi:hypothetical protein